MPDLRVKRGQRRYPLSDLFGQVDRMGRWALRQEFQDCANHRILEVECPSWAYFRTHSDESGETQAFGAGPCPHDLKFRDFCKNAELRIFEHGMDFLKWRSQPGHEPGAQSQAAAASSQFVVQIRTGSSDGTSSQEEPINIWPPEAAGKGATHIDIAIDFAHKNVVVVQHLVEGGHLRQDFLVQKDDGTFAFTGGNVLYRDVQNNSFISACGARGWSDVIHPDIEVGKLVELNFLGDPRGVGSGIPPQASRFGLKQDYIELSAQKRQTDSPASEPFFTMDTANLVTTLLPEVRAVAGTYAYRYLAEILAPVRQSVADNAWGLRYAMCSYPLAYSPEQIKKLETVISLGLTEPSAEPPKVLSVSEPMASLVYHLVAKGYWNNPKWREWPGKVHDSYVFVVDRGSGTCDCALWRIEWAVKGQKSQLRMECRGALSEPVFGGQQDTLLMMRCLQVELIAQACRRGLDMKRAKAELEQEPTPDEPPPSPDALEDDQEDDDGILLTSALDHASEDMATPEPTPEPMPRPDTAPRGSEALTRSLNDWIDIYKHQGIEFQPELGILTHPNPMDVMTGQMAENFWHPRDAQPEEVSLIQQNLDALDLRFKAPRIRAEEIRHRWELFTFLYNIAEVLKRYNDLRHFWQAMHSQSGSAGETATEQQPPKEEFTLKALADQAGAARDMLVAPPRWMAGRDGTYENLTVNIERVYQLFKIFARPAFEKLWSTVYHMLPKSVRVDDKNGKRRFCWFLPSGLGNRQPQCIKAFRKCCFDPLVRDPGEDGAPEANGEVSLPASGEADSVDLLLRPTVNEDRQYDGKFCVAEGCLATLACVAGKPDGNPRTPFVSIPIECVKNPTERFHYFVTCQNARRPNLSDGLHLLFLPWERGDVGPKVRRIEVAVRATEMNLYIHPIKLPKNVLEPEDLGLDSAIRLFSIRSAEDGKPLPSSIRLTLQRMDPDHPTARPTEGERHEEAVVVGFHGFWVDAASHTPGLKIVPGLTPDEIRSHWPLTQVQ